ncbi:hypothetical protein [Photobacterium kasasachensis]|uniref:hypothetical protein n=1 Tax=Photobacterium kasasachensis TaxID=2910240 RepID=UPI003D0DA978
MAGDLNISSTSLWLAAVREGVIGNLESPTPNIGIKMVRLTWRFDYLQDRESGKVVEGSKKYKVVETIWSFTLEDGQWKVSDIEEDDMCLVYAKTMRELPKIESTVEGDLRA